MPLAVRLKPYHYHLVALNKQLHAHENGKRTHTGATHELPHTEAPPLVLPDAKCEGVRGSRPESPPNPLLYAWYMWVRRDV